MLLTMQEIKFLVLEWYQNFKIFQRNHAHRTIHSETLGWGKAMTIFAHTNEYG